MLLALELPHRQCQEENLTKYYKGGIKNILTRLILQIHSKLFATFLKKKDEYISSLQLQLG